MTRASCEILILSVVLSACACAKTTDASLTNSPQWGNPNLDINDLNFGRITSAGGNRVVVLGARLNF